MKVGPSKRLSGADFKPPQVAAVKSRGGPTLLGLDHVRACTGRSGEAWTGLQKTLRWLESLRQTRYQFIAHDFISHLLFDLGLNELAVAQLERGHALGRDTGILFWRGEASIAEKDYVPAQAELSRAAALAEDIGRVRLQVDVESALARLHAAQGQSDAAQHHDAKARAIAEAIEKSLGSSGTEARLRMR